MLIWGTKPVKKVIATGQFDCPNCNAATEYRHMRVRRHGHIYWIPLFPIGEGQEYVECDRCKGAWQPAILERQAWNEARARDQLATALLATSVAVGSADGHLGADETQLICEAVGRLAGIELDPRDVQDAVRNAAGSPLHTALHVLGASSPVLGNHAKEAIVRVAILVASVDGEVTESEWDVLQQAASTLGITDDHLAGIMTGLARSSVPAKVA